MIDAAADLAAILDDCGGDALTAAGPLTGRFVEEPVEVALSSGQTVLSSEPVFYAERSQIVALELTREDWIDIPGQARRFIREIPRADLTGLTRIRLAQ